MAKVSLILGRNDDSRNALFFTDLFLSGYELEKEVAVLREQSIQVRVQDALGDLRCR